MISTRRRLWQGLALLALGSVAVWLAGSRTMAFARPGALAGLVMASSLALLLWVEQRRRRAARRRFAEPGLQSAMGVPSLTGAAVLRGAMLVGALTLIVLAAARPKGRLVEASVDADGVDLMICLDVSRSMSTRDMNGEARLTAAKRLLGNLVGTSLGDRLGLLVFAGNADVLCPFTLDHDILRGIIDGVDRKSVTQPGTALGTALATALETFVDGNRGGQAIVVLTDGESHESDVIAAAKEARRRGIVVHCVGVGTAQGDVVPAGTDILGRSVGLRWRGSEVISRLDEDTLREVARVTGGRYYRADSPDRLQDVLREVQSGTGRGVSRRSLEMREELYVWYLLPALLLLFAEPLVRWRPRRRRP
ncbi:MAG: VWA domain-containing protein [Armatimonadetes bacterium]|nr:VWA domain-containing protein [Armatimonadota bacterium]